MKFSIFEPNLNKPLNNFDPQDSKNTNNYMNNDNSNSNMNMNMITMALGRMFESSNINGGKEKQTCES